MKGTTVLMRKAMSVAVVVLRERLRWSQVRLAAEMNKWGEHKGGEMMRRCRISRWERRLAAPSPTHGSSADDGAPGNWRKLRIRRASDNGSG